MAQTNGLVHVKSAARAALLLLLFPLPLAGALAPTITSVVPAVGPPAGGTQVTITGTNFVSGALVAFGGTSVPSTFVSATQLTAITPPHATQGAVSVTVTNPDGQSATLAFAFSYITQPPTLTSITPAYGSTAGGTFVTITGTNFVNSASPPGTLTFGGVSTGFNWVSSTQLTTSTPPHAAGSVDVKFTNPDGQSATLVNGFTYSASQLTVTSITPNSGASTGGTRVVVKGTGFVQSPAHTFPIVYFGGSAYGVVGDVVDSTTMNVTTPAHPTGTVDVTVIGDNTGTSAILASGFAYTAAPPPTVTSVTPNIGAASGGTPVTIAGTNFVSGAIVDFGGVPNTPTFVSSTQFATIAPTHAAGAVNVKVTNPDGQSATLPGGFTYLTSPTITSIVPSSGTVGTRVNINGTNFTTSGGTVDFGGSAYPFSGNTSTLIVVASVPAHALGPVDVTVINSDGGSAVARGGFTYLGPAPTISSVVPLNASTSGGTSVTINGANFVNGAQIDFCNPAAGLVTATFISSSQLTAVAPPHVAAVCILRVVNPDGQSASIPNFTYTPANPPPTIFSVSPSVGTPSGGTAVTITGTNFVSGTLIDFGGASVTSTFISATQVAAITPAHAAGVVSVKVTNPDGQSATLLNGFTYTANPAPAITSISPASGPPAGGTAVTVNGTNFVSGAAVTFGSTSAGATFFDATKIIAITPPHTAGSVDVVVTNPDTQRATLTNGFAYVNAIPTITSISPTSGSPSGGTAVTINGTNFASGATVTFGGTSGGATFFDSTKIIAVTPAHAAGSVDVVVTNLDGGKATLTNGFTYGSTCIAPTISAQPQSVTITSGQSATLSVTAGGTAPLTYQWYIGTSGNTANPIVGGTNSSITVSPTSTTTYWVQVTGCQGPPAQSQTVTVTVNAACTPPSITSQPQSTTITSGQSATLSVTATGTAPLTYQWYLGSSGSTSSPITGGTNSSITVTPTTTTSYWVRVTGQCSPTADSATATVTVNPAGSTAPTITSISPNSGPTAGGTSVTVTGTNFVNGATVSFGGTASTSVTFTSAAQLRAVAPAHAAGAVSVTVTNPDNQSATLANGFTYTSGVATVGSFTADQTILDFGQSTRLRWTTTNAAFVTITGLGTLAANGSVDVTPRDTTAYQLVAYSSNDPANRTTATATVTVTVNITRAIVSFGANPSQIRAGEGAMLSWVTVRANSVSIDGLGPQPPSSSILVSPVTTATYRLTATGGPNGTETATATVSVIALSPPVIASFAANPPQIIEGQASTLIWSSSGGVTADIDNGVNAVPTSGQVVVRPQRTTIYALWVSGPTGATTKTATILVGPKKPPDIGTLAGTGGLPGSNDGGSHDARFRTPWSITVDSKGNTIIADSGNNTIRRVSPAGQVDTIAGNPGRAGSKDGQGRDALFNFEFYGGGVTTDTSGNIYVSDTSNNTIRKIATDGMVTTIAGSASDTPGFRDGPALDARFNSPSHLVVDSRGVIYVADTSNHTIRKIAPDGTVSTVAGVAGLRGYADGPGAIARFNLPHGLTIDTAGNLYVGDVGNDAVRKITPDGVVTTLAGGPNVAGKVMTNGNTSTARFNFGCCGGGLAIDSDGNVYVADRGSQTIRSVASDGQVSTIAGSGTKGSADGPAPEATFNNPIAVATDSSGRIYVADTDNHAIRATQTPTTRRRAVRP